MPKASPQYPVALFMVQGRGVVLIFDVSRDVGSSIDVRRGDILEITKKDGGTIRTVALSVEFFSSPAPPEKCPIGVCIDLSHIDSIEFEGAVASIIRPLRSEQA